MSDPGIAALRAAVPRAEILGELETSLLALGALALTGFFSLLRAALLHSVPSRILAGARSEEERRTLRPLLERAELLATSASIFAITCEILFVFFVVLAIGLVDDAISLGSLAVSLAVSVPLLVLATELLPGALRGEATDRLLRACLPVFDLVQRPLAALIYGLEATRRATMRLLRIPEPPPHARRIVEGLREVIEESEREAELQEAEREIIENVVEFYDVDVAEVMTPRTELHAVEIDDGIAAVVRALARSGHARIPVYRQSLDAIVGIVQTQDVLELAARGELERTDVRSLLRPVAFVPETKRLPELLADFRREGQKLAVVLDEYGGTAGIVTIGDIVAELVGDMRDDAGRPAPQPIRRLSDGAIEIDASTRVGEVNEELGIELPEEEDYETLAGFVLAELGRFPRRGESFVWNGIHFRVVDANDRRVLKVALRPGQPRELARR